jgi:aspartate dehydrogenase
MKPALIKTVGLIGFGGIGGSIIEAWRKAPPAGYRLVALLVRPRQLADARTALPDALVTDDLAVFLGAKPDIVIEAAGQPAVRDCAEAALHAGCEIFVISTGALADDGFRVSLLTAAQAGGGRIVIPVGATTGLDGLLAMRQDGLFSVTYTSTKPPLAWMGTPAEKAFDLAAIREPTVIFRGSARAAALNYPKNANLAATVAMASLGLDETVVQLVADPAATGNTGRIEAQSESSHLTVIVAGRSSASNPKTSAITGMSVLSALANRAALLTYA